jgi:hypothetical protein
MVWGAAQLYRLQQVIIGKRSVGKPRERWVNAGGRGSTETVEVRNRKTISPCRQMRPRLVEEGEDSGGGEVVGVASGGEGGVGLEREVVGLGERGVGLGGKGEREGERWVEETLGSLPCSYAPAAATS